MVKHFIVDSVALANGLVWAGFTAPNLKAEESPAKIGMSLVDY
jgi:hypothetical protein